MSPKVLGIMLTNGSRPAVMRRAIRCWQAQSYPEKALAILHSGESPLDIIPAAGIHVTHLRPDGRTRSIGELRNVANALSCAEALDAPILCHVDDDDYSHPLRIAEQVELLQASGAQAVGYHEALFWDTTGDALPDSRNPSRNVQVPDNGQAWLFSSPNPKFMLGTSLMYRRSLWEKLPFDNRNTAEDLLWQNKICARDKAAVSSLEYEPHAEPRPRMVCAIHGSNTTAKIVPGAREWRRANEYDALCQKVMAL